MTFLLAAAVAFLAANEDYVGRANCPEPIVGRIAGKASSLNSPTQSIEGHPEVKVPSVRVRREPNYPTYPKGVKRIQAMVVVEGTIDIDGRVGDIRAIACQVRKGDKTLEGDDKQKSCPQFSLAAENALSQWRYDPAVRDGSPVCVITRALFRFEPK